MPKTKQRKLKTENSYLKDRVDFLLHTKEFRIGVLAVAAFLIITGLFYFNKSSMKKQYNAGKTNIVSPIPEEPSSTKAAEVNSQSMKQPPVKMLADTAGVLTVEVRKGDNYWNISKRACGTGKFYLAIQARNNAQSLHPGNTVQVVCEE